MSNSIKIKLESDERDWVETSWFSEKCLIFLSKRAFKGARKFMKTKVSKDVDAFIANAVPLRLKGGIYSASPELIRKFNLDSPNAVVFEDSNSEYYEFWDSYNSFKKHSSFFKIKDWKGQTKVTFKHRKDDRKYRFLKNIIKKI